MDATCTIQDSIHVFNLVHKYVSRILGTYQTMGFPFLSFYKNHDLALIFNATKCKKPNVLSYFCKKPNF